MIHERLDPFNIVFRVCPPGGANEDDIVVLDCMDKRFSVDRPSAEWCLTVLKKRPYVISKQAPVKSLQGELTRKSSFVRSIEFGLKEAHANTIIVVAHEDCKANKAENEVQIRQLRIAAKRLQEFDFTGRIILLFFAKYDEGVDDLWVSLPVADSEGIVAERLFTPDNMDILT